MNSAEQERIKIISALAVRESRCIALLGSIATDVAVHYGVQHSAISIVDGERHRVVATHGFDPLEAPTEDSICLKVVQRNLPIIINNALFDPNYNSLPAVTQFPNIRFYCGCPLILEPAMRIGSLSVFDSRPRPRFTLNDTEYLVAVAAEAMTTVRREAQRTQHLPA